MTNTAAYACIILPFPPTSNNLFVNNRRTGGRFPSRRGLDEVEQLPLDRRPILPLHLAIRDQVGDVVALGDRQVDNLDGGRRVKLDQDAGDDLGVLRARGIVVRQDRDLFSGERTPIGSCGAVCSVRRGDGREPDPGDPIGTFLPLDEDYEISLALAVER